MAKKSRSYAWNFGAKVSVSAESAGQEFERIRTKRGTLTPKATVDESRPTEAVLHQEFEWNDRRAAELQREERARCLIRSLRVIEERTPNPKQERVYVNVTMPVSGAGGPERSYVPKHEVLSREELYRQALHEAISLLNGIRKRFLEIAELGGVFAEIEKVTQEIARVERATSCKAKRRAAS